MSKSSSVALQGLGPAFDDGMPEPLRHTATWRLEKEEQRMAVMREDLASWISRELDEDVESEELFEALQNGVLLCRLAQHIEATAEEKRQSTGEAISKDDVARLEGLKIVNIHQNRPVWRKGVKARTGHRLKYFRNASPGSFQARDNAVKFLKWCSALGLPEIILFESNDLVEGHNEKQVLQCLLEVARFAALVGVEPSDLVAMEMEVEREEMEKASQAASRAEEEEEEQRRKKEEQEEEERLRFEEARRKKEALKQKLREGEASKRAAAEQEQQLREQQRLEAEERQRQRQRQLEEERRRRELEEAEARRKAEEEEERRRLAREADERRRREEQLRRQYEEEQRQKTIRTALAEVVSKAQPVVDVSSVIDTASEQMTVTVSQDGRSIVYSFVHPVLMRSVMVALSKVFPSLLFSMSHSLDGRRWVKVTTQVVSHDDETSSSSFCVEGGHSGSFGLEPPALCRMIRLSVLGEYDNGPDSSLDPADLIKVKLSVEHLGSPLACTLQTDEDEGHAPEQAFRDILDDSDSEEVYDSVRRPPVSTWVLQHPATVTAVVVLSGGEPEALALCALDSQGSNMAAAGTDAASTEWTAVPFDSESAGPEDGLREHVCSSTNSLLFGQTDVSAETASKAVAVALTRSSDNADDEEEEEEEGAPRMLLLGHILPYSNDLAAGEEQLSPEVMNAVTSLTQQMSEELVMLSALVTGVSRSTSLMQENIVPDVQERCGTLEMISQELNVRNGERFHQYDEWLNVREQIDDTEDEVLTLLEDNETQTQNIRAAAAECVGEANLEHLRDLFRRIRDAVGLEIGDDEEQQQSSVTSVSMRDMNRRLWQDYHQVVKMSNEAKRLASQLEDVCKDLNKDADYVFEVASSARQQLQHMAPMQKTQSETSLNEHEENRRKRRHRLSMQSGFVIPPDRPFNVSHIAARVDAYNAWFDEYKRRQKRRKRVIPRHAKLDLSGISHRIDNSLPEGFKPGAKSKKKIVHAPIDVSTVSSRIDAGRPVPKKTKKKSSSKQPSSRTITKKDADVMFSDAAKRSDVPIRHIGPGRFRMESDRNAVVFVRPLRGRVMVRAGSDWHVMDSFLASQRYHSQPSSATSSRKSSASPTKKPPAIVTPSPTTGRPASRKRSSEQSESRSRSPRSRSGSSTRALGSIRPRAASLLLANDSNKRLERRSSEGGKLGTSPKRGGSSGSLTASSLRQSNSKSSKAAGVISESRQSERHSSKRTASSSNASPRTASRSPAARPTKSATTKKEGSRSLPQPPSARSPARKKPSGTNSKSPKSASPTNTRAAGNSRPGSSRAGQGVSASRAKSKLSPAAASATAATRRSRSSVDITADGTPSLKATKSKSSQALQTDDRRS